MRLVLAALLTVAAAVCSADVIHVSPDQTGTNGNISADPLFCDVAAHDLRVDAASPNLPGNPANTCGTLIGCFGQGCDSPVEARSWGRIKAIYREVPRS